MLREVRNFNELDSIANDLRNYKLICFDLDGTLINSEPLHISATKALLHEYQLAVDNDQLHDWVTGNADKDIWPQIQQHYISLQPVPYDVFSNYKDKNIADQINNSPNLKLEAEIIAFLEKCKELNLKTALVTASPINFAKPILQYLEMDFFFDLVITADDVSKTKPDPLPYHTAMQTFNVTPNETLIFEDSATGVKAAISSEATTYQVSWFAPR
ncbi:MAG: HAD family hydrolase [Bacteriovoracia bacterium]